MDRTPEESVDYRRLSSGTPTLAALFLADSLSPEPARSPDDCTVYSCRLRATMTAETSTAERVLRRSPVCESHARAFLEVVAGLQVADLVPPTFLGAVTTRRSPDGGGS